MNHEEDKPRDHIIERIVSLAADRHARDMKTASGILGEFFSRDPEDTDFVSSGVEGTWDTGFGMLVFSRTMAALFHGTQEVLEEVSGIPRSAKRRLDKVDKQIKKRHMKVLRKISDEPCDDTNESA